MLPSAVMVFNASVVMFITCAGFQKILYFNSFLKTFTLLMDVGGKQINILHVLRILTSITATGVQVILLKRNTNEGSDQTQLNEASDS